MRCGDLFGQGLEIGVHGRFAAGVRFCLCSFAGGFPRSPFLLPGYPAVGVFLPRRGQPRRPFPLEPGASTGVAAQQPGHKEVAERAREKDRWHSAKLHSCRAWVQDRARDRRS